MHYFTRFLEVIGAAAAADAVELDLCLLPLPALTVCLCLLVQRPQPEDGVPGRLHHAAGGHGIPLHPLPRPPRRAFNSETRFLLLFDGLNDVV